ncbi:MAG: TrkH family potassium uptake protein, partial [Eubacteriales bacterium]|nr:TrkH family potassium uptake protein [Eubacteriales bacterium]
MSFNYKVIIKVAGIVSIIIGIAMIPSVLVAFYYGEKSVGIAFIKSILLSLSIGFIILLAVRPTSKVIKMRDGYLIAASCWFIA